MKILTLLIVIALILSMQSGCSDDTVSSPHAFCECKLGETCTVALGSTFSISLIAAYTAGFWWEFEKEFDEEFVELKSYLVQSTDPDPDKDGVPMIQKWIYKAKEKGIVSGTMIYKCAWEEDPISKKDIVVIIK